jgi:hypothetical protein
MFVSQCLRASVPQGRTNPKSRKQQQQQQQQRLSSGKEYGVFEPTFSMST